jgi:hypothetical protein
MRAKVLINGVEFSFELPTLPRVGELLRTGGDGPEGKLWQVKTVVYDLPGGSPTLVADVLTPPTEKS